MNITVIIASTGRRDVLARTLHHLEEQSRRPDEIILSLADACDAPDLEVFKTALNVHTVIGQKGLAAQRNTGLDAIARDAGIVTFFDDDFLPATDYLARVETEFRDNADFAVIHGNVVADGVRGAGFSFEEGRAKLSAAKAAGAHSARRIADHPGAYGCNMSVRFELVGRLRFDERLVLYGWQEDIDFTALVGRGRRIVSISNIIGVHLGARTGRINGTRLGYSQIVNPVYLVRKGTMPLGFAADLIFRNFAANALKSLRPEPWIDRRGRLRGNIIALGHVMRGRVEPEYVLQL